MNVHAILERQPISLDVLFWTSDPCRTQSGPQSDKDRVLSLLFPSLRMAHGAQSSVAQNQGQSQCDRVTESYCTLEAITKSQQQQQKQQLQQQQQQHLPVGCPRFRDSSELVWPSAQAKKIVESDDHALWPDEGSCRGLTWPSAQAKKVVESDDHALWPVLCGADKLKVCVALVEGACNVPLLQYVPQSRREVIRSTGHRTAMIQRHG
eukprot:365643-Chlamydomonas_euryale.AAC.12